CGGAGSGVVQSGTAQSTDALSPVEEPELVEAIDLIATWLAIVGIGDHASMDELRAPEFTHRQSRAGDEESASESALDAARSVRACGDVELHVADDGYQVEMFVQVVRSNDTLAWGTRRLVLRRGPNGL